MPIAFCLTRCIPITTKGHIIIEHTWRWFGQHFGRSNRWKLSSFNSFVSSPCGMCLAHRSWAPELIILMRCYDKQTVSGSAARRQFTRALAEDMSVRGCVCVWMHPMCRYWSHRWLLIDDLVHIPFSGLNWMPLSVTLHIQWHQQWHWFHLPANRSDQSIRFDWKIP